MRTIDVLVALVSFGFGAYVGAWYQISQQTFKSESVVAKEIALLERHKDQPGCARKAIVDRDMTIAYDELASYCHQAE